MNAPMITPHNIDAERALLGAILRDPDVLPEVAAIVRPEALYLDAHVRIYTVALALAAKGTPVDLVSLFTELKRRGELDDVGGRTYLADLYDAVPTAGGALTHARLIRDDYQCRRLIHTLNEILRDAYHPTGSSAELLAQAEQKLFALGAEATTGDEPKPVGTLVRNVLSAIDGRIANDEHLSGLSTGYEALDHYTGGLRSGELIVIGARPSVGKTAFALNLADRVAQGGTPVLFFSLEQSGADIGERLLAMESRVPMSRMARAVELNEREHAALHRAGGPQAIGDRPIFVDDTSNATAAHIASVARRWHRRHGVRLIVIDYLGLMAPENPRDNQSQRIGTLALRMKHLARALHVPLLLLAQLNREVEGANRKPKLSDLRDSGEIEQHADRVLFLHREPNLDTSARHWPLEVVIAKNRNGPIGDLPLNYERPILRFETVPA